MNVSKNLDNYGPPDLAAILKRFQKKKRFVLVINVLSNTYNIIFIVIFFSLFIGMMNAFWQNDFPGMGITGTLFKAFFLFIVGIVIMGAVHSIVVKPLKKKYPQMAERKILMNLLNIVVSALFSILAWSLGSNYLGSDLNLEFVFRFAKVFAPAFVLFFLFKLLGRVELSFSKDFRKKVIPEIMKNLKGNLYYNHDKFLSKNTLAESGLYKTNYIYKYKGSDYFQGKSGDTGFEFSFLDVMEKEVQKSGGKTSVEIRQLFMGILYVTDFNKNFSGTTIVFPDSLRNLAGAVLGEMLNEVITHGKELVRLENEQFENEFAVFSTDQVEARYILSPLLMERIMDLRKKINTEMKLSFTGGKMFIALPLSKNMFDPDVFSSFEEEKVRKHYNDLLGIFFDIVEDLRLNTRIWGK